MSLRRRDLLALLGLELAAFGVFLPRLGFYHDDWVLLEAARRGTLWGFGVRPVEALLYKLYYAIGGLTPWPYQAGMLILEAAGAGLAYLLFLRILERRDLAFAAAALALLHPNHAATHHWFAASAQTCAIALVLAGLFLHQGWRESGGAARLAGALGLYLSGLLCYESSAFLFLMPAAAALSRTGPKKTARDFSFFMIPIALTVLWQKALAPHWLALPSPKALGFSPAHALRVYGAGFECVTNRVLHAAWLSLRMGLKEAPFYFYGLWAAAVLISARLLPAEETPGSSKIALAAAGGAFLGAYAPYALSADYQPQIFGVMSRTNAGGAWAGGLLVAALLFKIGNGRARRAAFAAILGAFLWTDWAQSWDWVRAWREESRILSGLAPKAAAIKGPAVVFLAEAPAAAGGSPVFEAFWGIDAALRLSTGRDDLQGDIWEEYSSGRSRRSYALPSFLYNARTGVLSPKESLKSGPPR